MATSLSSFQNMELGSFTPHCILRNYELGFRWSCVTCSTFAFRHLTQSLNGLRLKVKEGFYATLSKHIAEASLRSLQEQFLLLLNHRCERRTVKVSDISCTSIRFGNHGWAIEVTADSMRFRKGQPKVPAAFFCALTRGLRFPSFRVEQGTGKRFHEK
jgi:hypothetical protein